MAERTKLDQAKEILENTRILVVDSDAYCNFLLCERLIMLTEASLCSAYTNQEAINFAKDERSKPNLAIIDLQGEGGGVKLHNELRELGIKIPTVFTSSDPNDKQELHEEIAIIKKPFETGDLILLLAKVYQQSQSLRRGNT